jgi:DNA-binding transcriptional LysR family regulator
MQLKKLEAQAGKPLFRRSGRGLVPTEAGRTLLIYARQVIALNDEAATDQLSCSRTRTRIQFPPAAL